MTRRNIYAEMHHYEAMQDELQARKVYKHKTYRYGKTWIMGLDMPYRITCFRCGHRAWRSIFKIEIRRNRKKYTEISHFYCDNCNENSTGRSSIPFDLMKFKDD